MLFTAPATFVTLDDVCSAADEIAPTLVLSSSVADEIDEKFMLICSAAALIVLMFVESSSAAAATQAWALQVEQAWAAAAAAFESK